MYVEKIRVAHKNGIVLFAAILLLLFASIVILSITTFIIQQLTLAEVTKTNISNVYCAQAGIARALYDFRDHESGRIGYFSLGRMHIDTERYFILGAPQDANLLMVDTRDPRWIKIGGKGYNLLNLNLQNATNSRTLWIDRMRISWKPQDNPLTRVTEIRIDNRTRWSGAASSGEVIVLDRPVEVDSRPTLERINYIRFNRDISDATVYAEFILRDGSSTAAIQLSPLNNYNNFTLTATGKTSGSDNYRTIQAEYNTVTAQIERYYEIDQEMQP